MTKKKTIKQKGIGWILSFIGADGYWNKFREIGSGYGTYLSGAGSLLTGLAILWAELSKHDLVWVIENAEQLKDSNGVLLIAVGFAALFSRRSTEKVESKLDALAKK